MFDFACDTKKVARFAFCLGVGFADEANFHSGCMNGHSFKVATGIFSNRLVPNRSHLTYVGLRTMTKGDRPLITAFKVKPIERLSNVAEH